VIAAILRCRHRCLKVWASTCDHRRNASPARGGRSGRGELLQAGLESATSPAVAKRDSTRSPAARRCGVASKPASARVPGASAGAPIRPELESRSVIRLGARNHRTYQLLILTLSANPGTSPRTDHSRRASLRGQSAVISSVQVNSFSLRPYFAIARRACIGLIARTCALDPQHVELADEIAEDDRAVAGHQITPSECT
jgi:hypothetical protein